MLISLIFCFSIKKFVLSKKHVHKTMLTAATEISKQNHLQRESYTASVQHQQKNCLTLKQNSWMLF